MARTVAFTKGHGTGNDFVVVADPDGALELSDEDVALLCDRHLGVGADGLLRVVRSAAIAEGRALVEDDPAAEWFMDYRNADGSAAEMCGNGIRVVAAYLVEHGLVEADGGVIAVATRDGVKDVQPNRTGYQVDLGRWRLTGDEPLVRAKELSVARPGLGVDLGNPHVVVALADDDELERVDLGYVPVLDPAPADGANVEFVVPSDPLVTDGVASIRMRVHERGSGETLSCGTGVVAAALAVRHWAGQAAPDRWRVQVPGGTLAVRMFPTEEGEHVALSGPAALVFSGEIDLDA